MINATSDNNAIQNTQNLISNIVNQYIVKPLGGQDSSGVDGFVFDILEDEEILLDSDITDHYVEDNYAIQDHIALKPLMFTLRGYVAELNDLFSNTTLGLLTNIQSLSTIGGFLPKFSTQATQVYAKAAATLSKVGQVLNQAQNVYDIFFPKSTSATKQQNAYKYFRDLWYNRVLCTVETPYGMFQKMAIESVRALQPGTSRFVTDFSVKFKEIRTVSTISYAATPSVSSQKGRAQLLGNHDNGTTSGRADNNINDLLSSGAYSLSGGPIYHSPGGASGSW